MNSEYVYVETQTLEQISNLHHTGNVIPHTWYQHITYDSGKPDLLGTIILAEIVYWYRLKTVRDEHTGHILRTEKRFKGDMLQRSYQSFAEQFGVSKRSVIESIKRLEKKGVLYKEFRDIKTPTGVLRNVLFLAPVCDVLEEMQGVSRSNVTRITTCDTSDVEKGHVSRLNVTRPTFERGTYTETTTEITTEKAAADNNIGSTQQLKQIQPQPAAASFSNLKGDDLRIGSTLTDVQLDYVRRTVDKLNVPNTTPDQLMNEIQFTLLNPKNFSNAGSDFAKKLNTILKCINAGKWTSPAALSEAKEKKEAEQQHQHSFRLTELLNEREHWRSMLDRAVGEKNSGCIAQFKALHDAAQAKILDFSHIQISDNNIENQEIN